MKRHGIGVLLCLASLPADADAQTLPPAGPTRYVYSNLMGVGQTWVGPNAYWTFTFDHLSTDLWSWMLQVKQSGSSGPAFEGGTEVFQYFLTSATMHFPVGIPSGFPLSSNGCTLEGMSVTAGQSGIWSTSGCDIPTIPKPPGWYPGSSDWVLPPIDYASTSTWDIEGVGTASTSNCCYTLHLVSTTVLPEPGTVLLVGTGLFAVALAGRRRKRV